MDRQVLIQICKDAVVHHTHWSNQESSCAQLSIQSIYKGLTAGLDFKINETESDANILTVEFLKPIDFLKLSRADTLKVSTREEYYRDCDPSKNTIMLCGTGINFHSNITQSYMPTRKRLSEVGGLDWHLPK